MKNSVALISLVLLLALCGNGCRPEAYEQNRDRMIARTRIVGAGPGLSPDDLRKTREAYVDLVIGLNTCRHEGKLDSFADTVRYLREVIFNGDIPAERLGGGNRIVERFDGNGGWVLTLVSEDPAYRLQLNVRNERDEPVHIRLLEK